MKPYINWLMAPEQGAFRERVNQEWTKHGVHSGDRYLDGKELRVVGNFDDWKDVDALRRHPKARFQWLPSLGQLVRMIELVAKEKGVDGFSLEWNTEKGWYLEYWIGGDTRETDGYDEQPEIAAAQLWLRLEGVE